jgi:hypothetical protein
MHIYIHIHRTLAMGQLLKTQIQNHCQHRMLGRMLSIIVARPPDCPPVWLLRLSLLECRHLSLVSRLSSLVSRLSSLVSHISYLIFRLSSPRLSSLVHAPVELAHAGAARAGSAFARRAAAFRSGAERASVPQVTLAQVLGPNNAVEIPPPTDQAPTAADANAPAVDDNAAAPAV